MRTQCSTRTERLCSLRQPRSAAHSPDSLTTVKAKERQATPQKYTGLKAYLAVPVVELNHCLLIETLHTVELEEFRMHAGVAAAACRDGERTEADVMLLASLAVSPTLHDCMAHRSSVLPPLLEDILAEGTLFRCADAPCCAVLCI